MVDHMVNMEARYFVLVLLVISLCSAKCDIDQVNQAGEIGKKLNSNIDLLRDDSMGEFISEAAANEVNRIKKSANHNDVSIFIYDIVDYISIHNNGLCYHSLN